MAPRFFEVVYKERRQGLVPTPETEPAPRPHSNAPKINGSEGAFIGLVVALILIFLIACVAIFLLLRYNEPTDRERARRRRLSIRRRGAPHPLPIGLHDPDAAAAGGSLTEKLGNMFRGRRAGSGWVQASHDEWDSADEEGHHLNVSVGSAQEGKRATYVEQAGHQEQRATPVATPSPQYAYDDPFDAPPTSHSEAPTRPEYSHTQGGRNADGSYASYHTARGLSVESVQTFGGGTKFHEDM